MMKKQELAQLFDYYLNEQLTQFILSNPVDKEKRSKIKIRPLRLKEVLVFQAEEFIGKQVFHKNMGMEEIREYIEGMLDGEFRQAEVLSLLGSGQVLISKNGTITVKIKLKSASLNSAPSSVLEHNRKKRYLLEEGHRVPFLEDLGVLTANGAVIRSKYNKFRQINRFLEFIEDVLPRLDKKKETVIIDFGCGKSYLTFAMYYYLSELEGYPIRIIGLDLKQDVIDRCNHLAEKFGFSKLQFYHGDIASYEGVDHVDMVVTLHACDTATDYALAKAVGWGAKVILSVPCCQHELNQQIDRDLMKPLYQYGLIKERVAALYTDALRAAILENRGYRTQILEFIDMEHTPKNILIRAVKQGEQKDNEKEIRDIMQFLQVQPTLAKLLLPDTAEISR